MIVYFEIFFKFPAYNMPNIFYCKFCFDYRLFSSTIMLQDGTFQIDRLESLLTEVCFFRSVSYIDATYPIQYSCLSCVIYLT
jgi:hypothetical protein